MVDAMLRQAKVFVIGFANGDIVEYLVIHRSVCCWNVTSMSTAILPVGLMKQRWPMNLVSHPPGPKHDGKCRITFSADSFPRSTTTMFMHAKQSALVNFAFVKGSRRRSVSPRLTASCDQAALDPSLVGA